jgi:anti-anti-sigma factor
MQRRRRTVHLGGELDMAAREVAHDACVTGDPDDVVVDLTNLTFMDSRGYRALTTAQGSLRRRGATMSLRNPRGQPARLIDLVSSFEIHDALTLKADRLASGNARLHRLAGFPVKENG